MARYELTCPRCFGQEVIGMYSNEQKEIVDRECPECDGEGHVIHDTDKN